MTRHASTRSHHPPYQATTISQSATQLQQSALHRLRNPWIPGDCQSTTNSSSSSRTYHGIPSDGLSSPIYHSPLPEEQSSSLNFDNDSPYETHIDPFSYNRHLSERSKPYKTDRHHFRNDIDSYPGRVYPEDGLERRYFNQKDRSTLTPEENEALCLTQNRYHETNDTFPQTRNYLDDHGRLAFQQPIPQIHHQQFQTTCMSGQRVNNFVGRAVGTGQIINISGSASERAQSPGSLTGRGAVDGCGGHCIAFQNFCYYFLQVIFVIGILTGISLCIEGSAVRRNRGKDLSVLVYIGCLISMVCALLLSIQYCVRRNVERRKKALRMALNAIPMGDLPLQPSPATLVPPASTNIHQFNMFDSRGGFNRDTFRSGISTVPFVAPATNDLPDQNGIPWWRREPVRN